MSFQQFMNSRGKFSPQEIRLLILIVLGLVLVLALFVLGNYYLVGALPGGGQFYLYRIASHAFLFDRIEPYSANIPTAVQEKVFGRFATPDEKPYILDAPFHLLPLFFPLAWVPDERLARAFWMVALEIGLVSFLILSLRLVTDRLSIVMGVILVLGSCGTVYALQSLQEGSEVILLGLAYVGMLLATRSQSDELTGALLVISAFKWQVGGPFLLFIVVSVIWAQRWRVFVGAGMLAFVTFMTSFLLYPGWILPFLRATWNSLLARNGISTRMIFTSHWPEYGNLIAWVLAAVLVVALGFEWSASRGSDFKRVVWTAGLTIAATPLLGFRSEIENLVTLLFPWVLILYFIRERWKTPGLWLMAALQLGAVALPWGVLLGTFPLPFSRVREVLFLFFPAITVIGLYWVRWWMIRLPRTWLDNRNPLR